MKARILIVDDDRSIRVTLKHFLSEKGHKVTSAKDYSEAKHLITEQYFDLIIADIILGHMSGIDLLKDIDNRNMNCPVIMITGSPDIKTATEALRLGAFDYVPKPVTKEILLHVSSLALKHKSLNDEKEKYRLHLETIFKNINEGIITVDNSCVIREINGTAKRICGFSKNDKEKLLSSRKFFCDGKCVEIINETINKKRHIEVYRHECRQQNSTEKIVTLNASPLIDDHGVFSGAMLMIRDETHLDCLERNLQERKQLHNLVGRSDKMQKIYSLIEDLADVQTTVLITGESGTGKELIAEALHYSGNRKDKPLIKVNCSALQENLLESELFGHVKGAFTGAVENKSGRFQKADGGTIFLDEIGDISKRIQLKLLRVLQEKEFECVGTSTPIKVDVRVISATNQDLHEKVKSGEFREDLYYRLKVVDVKLPSLRENREDIPLLVNHFLKTFNRNLNRDIEAVSAQVTKVFMEYQWPGNIRELEHALEHAFVVCHNSTITLDHLPVELKRTGAAQGTSNENNEPDDKKVILHTLEKSGWNKSKAARILGISRPTIYRKIKENKIRENSSNKSMTH